MMMELELPRPTACVQCACCEKWTPIAENMVQIPGYDQLVCQPCYGKLLKHLIHVYKRGLRYGAR